MDSTNSTCDESDYSKTTETQYSTNSFSNKSKTSSIDDNNFTKINKYFSKKNFLCIIFIALFNISLILLNFVIFKNFINNTSEKKFPEEYQMVYYNKIENTTINEMIKNNFKFDGDFYQFEDKNGYGIIVKMNVEGEIYEMCSDECKCYVECEYDDDCENGFECMENVCVNLENVYQKRRGTDYENERKFAQVMMIVPIGVCIFGVFATTFLARKSAIDYFLEKCKLLCPKKVDKVEVNPDITEKKSPPRIKYYHCQGYCKLNRDRFHDRVLERWVEVNGFTGFVSKFKDLLIETYTEENAKKFDKICSERLIELEIISESLEDAIFYFENEAQIACSFVDYYWDNHILDDKGPLYSLIFNFGEFDDSCDIAIDKSTAYCEDPPPHPF